MRKYFVENRKVLNDEFVGDEKYPTLKEAMNSARHELDYSRNNYNTNKGYEIYVYSEDYDKNDEIIDNTYIEYLHITTDEYYNMNSDSRDKLFN